MPVTLNDDTYERIIEALSLADVALDNSVTIDNYRDDDRQRHLKALDLVRWARADLQLQGSLQLRT